MEVVLFALELRTHLFPLVFTAAAPAGRVPTSPAQPGDPAVLTSLALRSPLLQFQIILGFAG